MQFGLEKNPSGYSYSLVRWSSKIYLTSAGLAEGVITGSLLVCNYYKIFYPSTIPTYFN